MYWTLELASYLSDAPWPATKDELIDYSIRTGSPLEVVENLQAIEDEGETYDSIQEIWPDYPSSFDFQAPYTPNIRAKREATSTKRPLKNPLIIPYTIRAPRTMSITDIK
jgi:hypothetical protein